MNVNPLKAIWDVGGTAIGTYIMYSRDISTIQLAAASGLDFVLFDLEHRPYDYETLHDLCQVARLAGLAPLVGPEEISPFAISHVLDMGASGVVIPHVQTPEDVQTAINGVLYPPHGHRGRAGIAGHNLYNPSRSSVEEMEHYNSDVSLLLKVESESAIRRLKEIVAPDAVDGVMIGPSDLSLDLGIPDQVQHERMLELFDITRKVCRDRGIQYGTHVSSAEGVSEAVSSGASWVMVSSDMGLLSEGWTKASEAKPK